MENNETQLLITETCARMMYGVKAMANESKIVFTVLRGGNYDSEQYFIPSILGLALKINEFKLLLRPMSSMTKSETDEFNRYVFAKNSVDDIEDGRFLGKDYIYVGDGVYRLYYEEAARAIEWLNKNHFDYRGLIEKGLALEATEGIYKIKN